MASRPSKRQKRPIVLSSEDDRVSINPEKRVSKTKDNSKAKTRSTQTDSKIIADNVLPTRPRLPTRSKGSKLRSSTTIPESPPLASKTSVRKKVRIEDEERSRSLHAFFNAADARHQSQANIQYAEDNSEPPIDVDDIIEDDSEDDNFPKSSSSQQTVRSVLDRRKSHLAPAQKRTISIHSDKLPSASQKFLVDENQEKAALKDVTHSSSQPDPRSWVERFGPIGVEELAVHKKKVMDVRFWLENLWLGQVQNVQRLLVLKGPSGAGKTATVCALCKAMSIDISEWKNPTEADFSSESYVSTSSQFEDFLERSGKFDSLGFTIDHHSEPSKVDSQLERSQRKIILIEEFPNTFTSTSAALRSFRSNVTKYLSARRPSAGTLSMPSTQSHTEIFSPMVMIMTEAHFTSTSTSFDTFSAHRLLGPEILNHPLVSIIEFNPVAPTYITKALDLVVKKEARQSGRRRIPSPLVISKLGEAGDIRSAIGSLEFLCLRKENWDDWGGTVAGRAKRGITPSSQLTKMEKEILELVTQREASLGLFHAVGKVVYNKRDEVEATSSSQEPPTQLPTHLPLQTGIQVSQVSLDRLSDESGTDTSTFVATLHENYVTSCQGASFTDSLNGCIDALSDSDLLSSDRRGRFNSSLSGGWFGRSTYQGGTASDAMRQDDICFHVAVRGTLFALPYPVQRRAPPAGAEGRSGGKRDAFKMFYPASLKMSRQTEEVESLIDQWASRYIAGLTPLTPSPSTTPGASSQKPNSSSTFAPIPHHPPTPPPPINISLPPCPVTTSTKTALLLDTLPYVTAIERAANPASPLLADLETVTRFRARSAAFETEDAGEGEGEGEEEGGKDAVGGGKLMDRGWGGGIRSVTVPVENEMQRLWLSDDDIED